LFSPSNQTEHFSGNPQRGVDVRVMTAGKSDVRASYWATQHIYGFFLRNGVRVYEMVNRELHAKTATVDNMFAGVGSYNLDYLSYGHLLEANLNIMNSREAEVLEKQFHLDIQNCEEIQLATWENRVWYKKVFHWFAYHVYRFLLSAR
jgi:cardiolipin synthase A/B